MIEATSSAPSSAADGPSEAGAGKGAAASDPTGALFAMLLAGIVAPAPQAPTPTPKGGKGATAEAAPEATGPVLAMPAVGPLAAAQDVATLATAAAGAGQAAAAGERNGLPVTPDMVGKATGNPAPVVEKGKGKHTLGPAGKTGEASGPRAGHGRRAAAEAPPADATATTAQAPATAPAATAPTAGGSTTAQGDAQGQQTQQQQSSSGQEQPQQQGDVQVDALANVTSTSTATPAQHLAHTAHAAAPAAAAVDASQTPATPVTSFTQDHARFEHLVEGLSAKLHLSRSEGGSSLRMTLRPEELGQVTVRLQVGADGLTTASVTADSQQAASLLADAADDLRQALSDRGLQLDKLDVQSGGGSTLGDARPDSQQSSEANRDGNAPRSFYSFRAETEAASTATAVDAREGETGHSYLA